MATRRRICRIRVLAENSPVLANSSTRQNGHFGKLAGLDTFARHSPTTFPRTRYIRPPFANYFPRTRYIRPTFANPFPRTRYIRRVRRMYRVYRMYRV
jgi:hypothetical protein